jgi:hypothetical protein
VPARLQCPKINFYFHFVVFLRGGLEKQVIIKVWPYWKSEVKKNLLIPFKAYIDRTNPFVLGSRWCLNSGSPFFLAISLLTKRFFSVNLVPSANSKIWNKQV